VRTDPTTGKQVRGFAVLDPEKRRAIQEKGRDTIRAKATTKKWSVTEVELRTLHWEKGLSLTQIAGLYGIRAQTVLNRMRKLNIPRRGSVEATALRRTDPEVARHAANARRGSKSRLWKGGRTPFYKLIRTLAIMRDWRQKVFERDDYTCQKCGKRGGHLHADHQIPMAQILLEENIQTADAAEACHRLWDVQNGRTLCVRCHRKTPTFGRHMAA
jgi:DNA-binding CsgD family transcriptional regulator